jgi:alpha-ketoglutarate-dependent taurine dioxygenase
MAGNDFEVRRLAGSIGAEILGIDLASEPGDNAIGEIRQVWLEHNVIFFRDQDLPPPKFLAFAKRFGEASKAFRRSSQSSNSSARRRISAESGTPTLPISRYRQWGPC